MIDLLDNQLNVNQIILFNFYIYSQDKKLHLNDSGSFQSSKNKKISRKNLNSFKKKSTFFPIEMKNCENEIEKNEEIKEYSKNHNIEKVEQSKKNKNKELLNESYNENDSSYFFE